MSWPIGYGTRGVVYTSAPDGAVCADGVRATSPDGWVELPSPMLAVVRGGPRTFALRLRVGQDAEGRAFVYGEQVRVAGREHAGVFALLSREGNFWASRLVETVFAEIDRRRAAALDDAPRITRSSTNVRALGGDERVGLGRTETREDLTGQSRP